MREQGERREALRNVEKGKKVEREHVTFHPEEKKLKSHHHRSLVFSLSSKSSTIPPLALHQQGGPGVSLRSPRSLARDVLSRRAQAAAKMMNGRGSRGGGGAAAPTTTTTNATSAPMASGGAAPDLAGSAPDDNDWSTYFCTYAYLYHQVRD